MTYPVNISRVDPPQVQLSPVTCQFPVFTPLNQSTSFIVSSSWIPALPRISSIGSNESDGGEQHMHMVSQCCKKPHPPWIVQPMLDFVTNPRPQVCLNMLYKNQLMSIGPININSSEKQPH